MRRVLGLAVAIVAVAWAASDAGAADDPLLKRLVGEWEGSGIFRWDSASAPERVYCKLTNALASDGTLRQSGRCALASDSAALTIDIQAAGRGAYIGTATGALGLGIIARRSTDFTGAAKGNQLVLTAPPGLGDAGPTTTTIDLLAKGFRARVDRIDAKTGAKFTATDVMFGPL